MSSVDMHIFGWSPEKIFEFELVLFCFVLFCFLCVVSAFLWVWRVKEAKEATVFDFFFTVFCLFFF